MELGQRAWVRTVQNDVVKPPDHRVDAATGPAVVADIEHRVRAICLGFPEVTEKTTHGAPGFFVRKQFAMLWPRGHHDRDFAHLWCAAEPGAQEALTAGTGRYFRPPYVGHRGWVGVRLDGDVDWLEVAELLEDAYRLVAPARLVARLDEQGEH